MSDKRMSLQTLSNCDLLMSLNRSIEAHSKRSPRLALYAAATAAVRRRTIRHQYTLHP